MISQNASSGPMLEITRVFPAPRPLVFRAWTKKEYLDQWCAPSGFTIPFSEGDLRPGGKWKSCMVSPSGEEFRLGGTYLEIVENELLVFSHIWEEDDGPGPENTVTVRLSDDGEGTRMVFTHGPIRSEESRDSHQGGWSECFDKLEEILRDDAR